MIKNKDKEYFTSQKKLLKSFTRYRIFNQISNFLKEANYPFHITFELYIFFMILCFIFFVYIYITETLKQAMMFAFIILAPFHILLYQKYKERRNNIRISLCDIQDIVYMQSKIGTQTDVILANAARLASEPLKTPLEKVASSYKITRDLDKSLDILLDTSNIMELQAFTFILKQKENTGFSSDNHKAQSIMLKRNKRLRRRLEREIRRNKLLVAGILLFACYTSMLIVPIIKETIINIKQIL